MKNYNVKIPEDTINQIIIDYKSKSNQLARNKKTKACYKDAVITGVGYAVCAVIWFYL